jgi:putative phosphoribosyl transferase
MKTIFKDRSEAGQLLAKRLGKFTGKSPIIVAVPRGGVEVANIIAKRLRLPLEVMLTKKIHHPLNTEFVIGAVSLNDIILQEHEDVSSVYIDEEASQLREDLKRKQELYIGNREPADLNDKTVILVDDGIASGKTILLAIKMLRARKPKEIVLAIPVLPHNLVKQVSGKVDQLVYIIAPYDFTAISDFYEGFDQVSDEQVAQTLAHASAHINPEPKKEINESQRFDGSH